MQYLTSLTFLIAISIKNYVNLSFKNKHFKLFFAFYKDVWELSLLSENNGIL